MKLAGYAALFNRADAGKDIIRPGAFAETLAERTTPLPLRLEHKAEKQIGQIAHIAEDARGLRVVAKLDNPSGRAAHMLRSRQISGLSFGFRTLLASHTRAGRVLHKIALFEISLVTYPLQHRARVHLLMDDEASPAPQPQPISLPVL